MKLRPIQHSHWKSYLRYSILNRIWKWKIQRGQLEDEFGRLKNGTLPSSDHRASPRLWTVFRQMLHDTLVVFQILYFVFSSDSNKIPVTEFKKIIMGSIMNVFFACRCSFHLVHPLMREIGYIQNYMHTHAMITIVRTLLTAFLPFKVLPSSKIKQRWGLLTGKSTALTYILHHSLLPRRKLNVSNCTLASLLSGVC